MYQSIQGGREMKRRMTAVFAMTGLALSLITGTALADGGTIESMTIVESQPPATLDPASNNGSAVWSRMCFEYLYGIDGNYETYPMMADQTKGEFGGYDHEAGSNVYDVYIYDYITDSDGNNITADDVIWCYETAIATGHAGDYTKLQSMEAVDDYTIRFTFEDEVVALNKLNDYWNNIRVFSKKAYEDHGNFATEMCATGRYVVTSFTADVGMDMEKRADYWQTDESLIHEQDQANVDKIHIDFVGDSSQQVMALQSGEVELVQNMSPKNASVFEADDSFVIDTIRKRGIYTLYANVSEDSILSDENLRKAVFYSIDADQVTLAMGEGTAEPTHALASNLYEDYNAAWEESDSCVAVCDNDKAKELLKDSTYNGETVRILYGSYDPNFAAIGQVVQMMLMNNGIACELAPYDMANFGSVHEDPTMWELWITSSETSDSMNANLWNDVLTYEGTAKNMTKFFAHDETLQGYLDQVMLPDTHTTEMMDEAYAYIAETAYAKPLCNANICSIYKNILDKVVYSDQQNVVIQSCTFK